MVQITLTPEQAAAIATAGQRFVLVDQYGNRVAVADPLFTSDEVKAAVAARNSDDPRRTTAEVLSRMHSQTEP